jgi:hypothetical protein
MKDLQIWIVKGDKEYNLYYTASVVDFAKEISS